MEKRCFKCYKILPIEDFYKHKRMGDGHLNKCKYCTKNDVREREERLRDNQEWVDSERNRGREKYHRLYRESVKPTKQGLRKQGPLSNHKMTDEEIRANRSMSNMAYSKSFPEKKKAYILSQRIEKKLAENHLHHWSYNVEHAKDVIELSQSDHYKIHRFIIYDQERFMYRRYDTNELLDTRESHEAFIQHVLTNLQ